MNTNPRIVIYSSSPGSLAINRILLNTKNTWLHKTKCLAFLMPLIKVCIARGVRTLITENVHILLHFVKTAQTSRLNHAAVVGCVCVFCSDNVVMWRSCSWIRATVFYPIITVRLVTITMYFEDNLNVIAMPMTDSRQPIIWCTDDQSSLFHPTVSFWSI